MMNKMREDWIEVELGEVCSFIGGGTPSKNNAEYWNGNVPWASIKDLKGDFLDKTQDFITEYGLANSATNLAVENEIILATRINPGKPIISRIKTAINQDLKIVRFYPSIDIKFLFYSFKNLEKTVIKLSSGTTVLGINLHSLNTLKTPLAPLPIQRAIVSKIEALFSDLDNGIANFKKAQEQLKIYRQAVLKKAFEGEFSITNEELKITNEELRITNEGNLDSDNLPKGWKWVNSGEFFSFVTSGSRGWAKYYSESGSIFIRITNLNFDTLNLDLREEKIQYINPPKNSEGLRTKVKEGDFLFSITGYLGMFAIAPKLENAFVNQHVSLCRPKDFFNKKYLAYWIISKSGGHYHLNKNQKGAVKAGLNLDDLKTFPVPLPPTIAEQTQIVQEIERRLSVCDKMEQSIKESLAKAEALRQSILKKAFEGKLLTEAEIQQCKQEADYEPASELLKKIQAEKAVKGQATNKKKQKE